MSLLSTAKADAEKELEGSTPKPRRVSKLILTYQNADLNLIYNDSYAAMSMKKHPSLFGAPAAVGWSEIWEGLKSTAMACINDDVSVQKHDDLLFMQRDGDTTTYEEVYFSWSWSGVKDESGRNGGMLNRAWETTTKVLAERRLLTLRELVQATCKSTRLFFAAQESLAD